MSRFSFTSEQIDNLKSWANSLKTEEARKWLEEEAQAESETSRILNDPKFVEGEDLAPQTLDKLFSLMRHFSNNRNLSSLLYKTNSLHNFNQKLRNLLHGTDPFPERVNEFFKLKSMGIQTLSQFLVAVDSAKYPLVTSQTKEVLNVSSDQDQVALEDSLDHFQVRDRDNLLERTLDYLRDFIIFKSVKELLNLEKYTAVNNLLWFEFAKGDEEGPGVSYASLSSENDLRDFLANDASLIEKGLTLVGKEYSASGAGNIDLLCKDKKGMLVVVELKKGRESDKVVGQILRYLGWVEKNQRNQARGIIIVNEPDEKLDYALIPLKGLVKLKFYRVNFEIRDKLES